jgi:O-acetyl-ADP-ribose deacetylase (regulator of RNase III)
MKLQFVFFDNNKHIIDAYMKALKPFESMYKIKYDVGDIKHIVQRNHCTCIVSPANSFGEMNGGIDLWIAKMFPDVQKNVYRYIKSHSWYKSQTGVPCIPVGDSMLCGTGSNICPYIVIAPTMFKPSDIRFTDNVYRAFISILDNFHDRSFIIGVSGMGTGVGNLSAEECAKQVALAFKHFIEKQHVIDR